MAISCFHDKCLQASQSLIVQISICHMSMTYGFYSSLYKSFLSTDIQSLRSNFLHWSYYDMQLKYDMSCVPSMIHSARSTVPPAAITSLAWKLLCFARFWKVGTDVQTARAKIVITTGRDCGSVSWINIWKSELWAPMNIPTTLGGGGKSCIVLLCTYFLRTILILKYSTYGSCIYLIDCKPFCYENCTNMTYKGRKRRIRYSGISNFIASRFHLFALPFKSFPFIVTIHRGKGEGGGSIP